MPSLTAPAAQAKAAAMASETPPDAHPTPPVAPAAPPAASAETEAPPEKKKESWWETLRFFLILFVAAVMIRSLLFAPFSIPSGSMLPNLMIGDYLFVAKWPYGYSRYSFPFGVAGFDGRFLGGLPERGDIVVFRYPGPQNEDFVKRVIGLPGDTIEVRAGTVILNSRPTRRQRIADYVAPITANSPCRGGGETREIAWDHGGYCAYPRYRETLPSGRSFETLDQVGDGDGDTFGPIVVPEGQVFVMGDNRDDSLDSRFDVRQGGVGLLPVDHLLGRALIGFWSTDGSAEWIKPWTWFTAARWERIGQTW
jgi:signal peptidase I